MQALLVSHWGRAHGYEPRHHFLHCDLSHGNLCSLTCRGACRLCLWPRSRRGVALNPDAAGNRDADRLVWADRPGYAVWQLRHAIQWRHLTPLLVGAALGVFALSEASPHAVRIGVGAVLAFYSLYGLFRPSFKPLTAGGSMADGIAGFLNGALGGATGFAGIIATIWCQLRGWPKDQQRAIFQPVGVATFAMSAAWLGGQGSLPQDTLEVTPSRPA
jgi:hypothetical protein